MITHIIIIILLSISPLGESRVGIPYGIINGVPPVLTFILGLSANLLVYPIMVWLVRAIDKRLWHLSMYRKQSVKLMRRAKNIVGNSFEKYGFWGLMLFVMIPLPATGAYIGSIAAILFKVPKRKAFPAISIGVVISALIIAVGTYFGLLGIENV